MKAEFENTPLKKNEAEKRFELEHDGHLVTISYSDENGNLALDHVVAEPALRGTGAAGATVEKTLTYAEEHGKKILPYCPYLYSYIQKHKEWKRVVSPDFADYDNL